MDRKKFLQKLGLGMLAGGTLANASACKTEPIVTPGEDCLLTGEDILGPYFVSGTAEVVNLNTQNLAGTPMMVSGKVYGGEEKDTPLANVRIDIWHADDNGTYHPEGSGDVSDYDSSEITLRGFVITEADGSYAFRSIVPGLYGSRARHIHFRLEVEGYKTLVTQTYFAGDNRISRDTWASEAGDCRIIEFSSVNGVDTGVMDFNLGSA
ncbi:MAG: hypothetical protein AAF927_29010 [Bacteroidota bacterium]